MRAAGCRWRRISTSGCGIGVRHGGNGSLRWMRMYRSCASITILNRAHPFRAPGRNACSPSSTLPQMVLRASATTFPGVTDTSSNLGVAGAGTGRVPATFKVRSLQDARADELADKLVSHAGKLRLARMEGWRISGLDAEPGVSPARAVPAGVHRSNSASPPACR